MMTTKEKREMVQAAPIRRQSSMYLRDTQWTAELWHKGLRAGVDMDARKSKKYTAALCMLAASVASDEFATVPLGNTPSGYWKDMQGALQHIADSVLRGGSI